MSNNLATRTKESSSNFMSPIRSLQSQVDSLFDNFFDGFRNSSSNSNLFEVFTEPKVNVSEDNKAYYVEAEMAGVKKEDLKVECDGNYLSIRAEKKEEKNEEKKNYHRMECSYGQMMRSFALPDNVNGENIDAQMKDGVLKIVIPKTKKSGPEPKEIKIK